MYISLGSSIIQLHESLGRSRACACSKISFSSQNGEHTWGAYCQRAEVCYAHFVRKRTQWKWYSWEMVRVFGGKCLSRKAVFTNGSRNSLKEVRMSQMMPYQVALLRLQQKKRLLCCGFRRTGKAMGQVYVHQCWWRIFREINGFPTFEYHTSFTFYIHLWPIYRLSLVTT
jgi:hypothetical protein